MLPILALLLATWIGGWVNTVDLKGRVVDDFTGKGIINAGLTHPFPIWRVGEILDWVESGEYQEVMNKQ